MLRLTIIPACVALSLAAVGPAFAQSQETTWGNATSSGSWYQLNNNTIDPMSWRIRDRQADTPNYAISKGWVARFEHAFPEITDWASHSKAAAEALRAWDDWRPWLEGPWTERNTTAWSAARRGIIEGDQGLSGEEYAALQATPSPYPGIDLMSFRNMLVSYISDEKWYASMNCSFATAIDNHHVEVCESLSQRIDRQIETQEMIRDATKSFEPDPLHQMHYDRLRGQSVQGIRVQNGRIVPQEQMPGMVSNAGRFTDAYRR